MVVPVLRFAGDELAGEGDLAHLECCDASGNRTGVALLSNRCVNHHATEL